MAGLAGGDAWERAYASAVLRDPQKMSQMESLARNLSYLLPGKVVGSFS